MSRHPPEGEREAPARQPTMADVAELAQVSTATVSYLLSGRDELMRRVGADAQERIRQAVDQLGYVQNKTARHLRRQRTERLCVVLPRLGIPFADRIAREIDEVARARGYATIVMAAGNHAAFARVLREIEGGLADGLIADCETVTIEQLDALLAPLDRLNKACLLMHADHAGDGVRSVMIHERSLGLGEALAHLVAAGHRHLAYISNRSNRPDPRASLVRAFVAEREDMAAPLMADGAESRPRTVERAREIAALDPRPTVVLLESDFTAVTAIEEFQRLGLRVPEDIAVIGCGNAEEGFYCNPRLTTIGPASWSMTEATGHLIDLVEGRAAGPRRFRVPWTLYPRDSG